MQYGSIKLDTKRLDEIANKLGVNTDNAVKAIAFQMEGRVKKYIVMKKIVDTGAYLNSIMSERKGQAAWEVHDGVEYGIYQEFGHHNVAARPHWEPALQETAQDVAKIMGEALFKEGGFWTDDRVWKEAIYK